MYTEDLEDLPRDTRVWIYQADRLMTEAEQKVISNALVDFCTEWISHGTPVQSSFEVEHGLFILIYGVEPNDGVSGCSIDSSVAVLRKLESELGIRLFDRQTVAWEKDGLLTLTPMHEFWAMRKAGLINDQTVVFDNLVKTLSERRDNWKTTFNLSWHSTMW